MPQPALGPLGKGPVVIAMASFVKPPVSRPASGADALAPVGIDASVPCEACPEGVVEPDVVAPVAEAGVELVPLASSEPLLELEVEPLDAPADPKPDAPADTDPCGVLEEHAIGAIMRRWKGRRPRTSE